MSLQRKRKRLDGASIAPARSILEKIIMDCSGMPLSAYCHDEGAAYLCHNCEKQLMDIAQIEERKEEVCLLYNL